MTHTPGPAAPTGVDWDLARTTAGRLVRSGPSVTADEAHQAVAELRYAAERADAYVAEATGLDASVASEHAPVLVVDRLGWVEANIAAFGQILSPLGDRLGRDGSVAARVAGVELGAVLGYLAPKILGQFDPYAPPSGRLLLIAPNVVHIERQLRLPPADFRLWVCLHEETHRVQFTAVPWLRDHLRALIDETVTTTDLSLDGVVSLLRSAAHRVLEGLTDRNGERTEAPTLLDLVPAEQQGLLDRITAIMTLLEGHADYMMDRVGPEVIPSIAQIRARFDARREHAGLDGWLRRLLGLDAKLRQYKEGARFVDAVITAVGRDAFNTVWSAPEGLPSLDEIATPDAGIRRVVPRALPLGS